jgi:hypothetical protein
MRLQMPLTKSAVSPTFIPEQMSQSLGTDRLNIYIYIFVKLQLGFNPVAVVQQYNRQVTHITHKQSTNTKKHNNK